MAAPEDNILSPDHLTSEKSHKKERKHKHKHKKEKKHKRHRERERSPQAEEPTNLSAKNNHEQRSLVPTDPTESLATLKRKAGESPSESGEIDAPIQPGNDAESKGHNGHLQAGEKHQLERDDVKDVKRPRTDTRDSTIDERDEACSIGEALGEGTEVRNTVSRPDAPLSKNPHDPSSSAQAQQKDAQAPPGVAPIKEAANEDPSTRPEGQEEGLEKPRSDDGPSKERDSDARARSQSRARERDQERSPRQNRHHRSKTPSRRANGETSRDPSRASMRERSRDRSKVSVRERSRDRPRISSRSSGRDRSVDHGRRGRPEYASASRRDHRRSPPRDYRRDQSLSRGRDSRDYRPDHRGRSRYGGDSRDRRRSASRGRRARDDREKREESKKSQEKADQEFAEKVIAKLEENEVDEDELIEQRRRKRQELMKKLQEEKQQAEAVAAPTASEMADGGSTQQPGQSPQPPASPALTTTSAARELHGAATLTPTRAQSDIQGLESDTEDEDMAEINEADLFSVLAHVEGTEHEDVDKSRAPTPSEASSDERHKLENQTKKDQAGGFDMFAESALNDIVVENIPAEGQAAAKHGLVDQFDDSEGYYNFQVGELLNERYEVFATHGKGVFSTVLRARDLHPVTPKGEPIPVIGTNFPEVAIKVIRSNDLMTKAGKAEEVILQKLAGADPSNKYHVIRLLGSFKYRGHLCLCFEPLESNLRQLTKKYGQGIGLRLDAVRSMAAQMLMALHLMKQCGVLHADIKPDNILINKGHNIVKICDFGSAMFTGTNEITPYLVSRFYRAPEIILGLPYDHPLDVWSIGCVVYELFTGRILFPGRTNNEMLKLIMDLKGAFPKKMLKKAQFAQQHFEDDPNMSFCLMEVDPLTKRPVRRLIANPTVKKDFRARFTGQEGGPQLANLIDFLEKMLHLDPDKRITAKEALRHPFIKAGRPQAK